MECTTELKLVSDHLAVHSKRAKRDLLAVALALVIGIGGQILMLDPIQILYPTLPMLSHRDWLASHVAQGLEISENVSGWRQFFIRMEFPRESRSEFSAQAFVEQKTNWYDNPLEPASMMEYHLSFDFRNEQPIAESSLSEGKPESKLFCSDYGYVHYCTYLAYIGHWYTRVDMLSRDDEYLSHAQMLQIANHVEQLLVAAPEKP